MDHEEQTFFAADFRLHFSVPLEPRSPRFFNVTSRSIGVTWLPPSNARNLGPDLLGYRIYVAEKRCGADANDNRVAAAAEGARRRRKRPRCRKIAPITINSGKTTKTIVRGLGESIALIANPLKSNVRGAMFFSPV